MEPFRTILSPIQIVWLKDMQTMIDESLKIFEPDSHEEQQLNISNTKEREHEAWRWYILCDGKIRAGAQDMRIPEWAIPNVKAIWDAKRNRLGKGIWPQVLLLLFC